MRHLHQLLAPLSRFGASTSEALLSNSSRKGTSSPRRERPMVRHILTLTLLLCFFTLGCSQKPVAKDPVTQHTDPDTPEMGTAAPATPASEPDIIIGAERTETYFPELKGKRIGLVVNHTSFIHKTHLVDSLLSAGFDVRRIFAPEHGFRGQSDAGATVQDGKDSRTGLPIVSLYGQHKKPKPQQLRDLDLVLFDIQDVGARFYTYISTMHYVMEACAEAGVPVIVLDRPNPNGHYVDGPMLEAGFQSFVGMHDIPVVHGLTVAELAHMINGEGWLENGIRCNLLTVECRNYTHDRPYELPIKPSPNLPNARSILLYPSLCFFEGTEANAGRGTNKPFQIFGHPDYPVKDFEYTPVSMPGAKHPKFKGERCYGVDLSNKSLEDIRAEGRINLDYLLEFYQKMPDKKTFILKNKFIDKLAGTDNLRTAIIAGKTADEIRVSWQKDLGEYRVLREKYLLYE